MIAKLLRPVKWLAETLFPLIFWVLLIFGFDSPDVAVLTIIAALIHELGHICAIALTRRAAVMRSHVSGFRIRCSASGYRDEILTLAAGPLANIMVFFLALPFFGVANGYIMLLGYINLLSGMSNLLPVEGYDGYGILHSIASALNSHTFLRILYGFSFFLSILLTFLSLYLILRFGSGYWIFGIFFITLTGKIRKNLPSD